MIASVTKFKEQHYDILLAQLIQSEDVAELAFSAIEPAHFHQPGVGGSRAQGIMYKVIRDYRQTHGSAPDKASLVAELQVLVRAELGGVPELARELLTYTKHFLKIIEFVDPRSSAAARKMIEYIHEVCIFKPTARGLLDDAKSNDTIDGLVDKLTVLEERQSALTGGNSFTGIIDMEMTDAGERISTGIPWLDARFGGGAGPTRGCVMGIIAPQGCGKTSLGIQMAVNQAMSGRHALLVIAEEGLSNSVRSKIIACALGIPYELILSAKCDVRSVVQAHPGLDQDIASKRLELMNEYFHVLDLVRDGGGIAKIMGELRSLESRGQSPIYTYVDWAGMMADAMLGNSDDGREYSTKESALKSISYSLNTIAAQTNGIIAIAQQMAGEAVKKGPFHMNDSYCAADCRGFTEPMKYVFVINPQDPRTGYSLLTVTKSRDDNRGERQVMHLKGEIPMFLDLSDSFEVRGKRFMNKRAQTETNTVPSER